MGFVKTLEEAAENFEWSTNCIIKISVGCGCMNSHQQNGDNHGNEKGFGRDGARFAPAAT